MKVKLEKKLVLNKKTVSDLSKDDMKITKAGGPLTKETRCPDTCYTCNLECL